MSLVPLSLGAVDGVAATATTAGVRVGCKIAKVAINTTASILHNSNAENKENAHKEVSKAFMKSFLLQAGLNKYDRITGKLDNEVLALYMLDGKIGYGITNILLTAAIRIGSNIARHTKGIISQVF